MSILYETLGYDLALNTLLQKQIRLSIDDKTLRQGHFVLYAYKNFAIELYFKNDRDGKVRKTEIPIPLKVTKNPYKDIFYFDYQVNEFFAKDMPNLKALSQKTENTFFNSNLKIETINI